MGSHRTATHPPAIAGGTDLFQEKIFVLVKRLVIPCFTWTVQLPLSAAFLDGKSRLRYLMAITLHVLLRRDGFHWRWTISWLVLIVINMSLYLSSVL
jgi:hypothetical protein